MERPTLAAVQLRILGRWRFRHSCDYNGPGSILLLSPSYWGGQAVSAERGTALEAM